MLTRMHSVAGELAFSDTHKLINEIVKLKHDRSIKSSHITETVLEHCKLALDDVSLVKNKN